MLIEQKLVSCTLLTHESCSVCFVFVGRQCRAFGRYSFSQGLEHCATQTVSTKPDDLRFVPEFVVDVSTVDF